MSLKENMPDKIFYSANPKAQSSLPLLVLNVQNQMSNPKRERFGAFHWHDDLQFILVLEGIVRIQTLQNEYSIKSGEGIFINACVLHRVTEKKTCHYHSYIFPDKLLPGYGTSFFSTYVMSYTHNKSMECVLLHADCKTMLELMALDTYYFSYENNKNIHVPKVAALLASLWATFITETPTETMIYSKSNIKRQHEIEKALLYIHNNYGYSISIEDIAAECNISKTAITRHFQNIVHMSPYKYLIDYRIKKSVELLNNSTLSVSEIATKAGYNSQSQFGKHFKERMHISPKQYRKSKIINNY